jgi:ABC-2 type transport system ATP-binding protein
MKALVVEGVSHRFGSRAALTDVSFTMDAGSFVVLLGRNGAGKTTLMSLIARLHQPLTGGIRVFNHSIRLEPALSQAGESPLDSHKLLNPCQHFGTNPPLPS